MPSSRVAFLVCFASAAFAVEACSVYDESLLGAGGSGATSGQTAGQGGAGLTTGPTTGTSGTVTTGGGCATVDECPGDDSECLLRTCDQGACALYSEPQGKVVSGQTAGDCLLLVCDGTEGIETVADASDVPADDGNACTAASCSGGAAGHVNLPAGTPCAQGGGSFCSGAGACVECLEDIDCGGGVCTVRQTCVAASCGDGLLNGQETDTDCGGSVCGGCALGDTCGVASDCLSGACAGTCQPSCSDGAQNNGESAVDCGGPGCAPCPIGLTCVTDDDCSSDFCQAGVCRPLLFFSEYIEGSSNNKALEIFNFGNEAIDLAMANCSVQIHSNGSVAVSSTIGLVGVVDVLETHVVCHGSAGPALLPLCDQTAGSSLNFNGDDALTLVCAGARLDSFGQIGFDPGTAWISGAVSTADATLRRKGSVLQGDPIGDDVFDPAAQWNALPTDDFTNVGVHP